jgi:hypothetical protein
MVSKCANPDCSNSFRYFHQGKLFRIDTTAGPDRRRTTLGRETAENGRLRRLEFFWLCDSCAESLTLIFDLQNGVSVQPRERSRAAAI